MQNHITITPRFSDFNIQGLLKASTHLDLACEAQLAQMASRYSLPLSDFTKKSLRWHIADFKISYPKSIKTLDPVRIEADVVAVEDSTMVVDFLFSNEAREIKYAFGTIRFELVDANDASTSIPADVKQSLIKNGRIK